MQEQLPRALNHWLSEAAILSAEESLGDANAAKRISPEVINALRYRHSVLKGHQFESNDEYMQHQMLGRGRIVQVQPNASSGLSCRRRT